MATTTALSMIEYLDTSYRPDREYVDGELRQRNLGKWEHARLQLLLATWIRLDEKAWGTTGSTEQRIQVSSSRIRIPDLVMLLATRPPDVLVDPPLLVIEILSPDDRYSDVEERASDYRVMGVGTVWLIDPASRTGRMCIEDRWVAADKLVVPGTPVMLDLHKLFKELDGTDQT